MSLCCVLICSCTVNMCTWDVPAGLPRAPVSPPRLVPSDPMASCIFFFLQLGLQEAHRVRRSEESRGHLLHELTATDLVLHK